ncbi:hypothetical protein GQ55_5G411800 [Panicum hallii var. hallii]|uniref:Uncharacterized protein n=1 Tax=Panicum hallii var. hallii TaxID=1504633 RepID=A0A2T7DNQ7_9POAL|nr:hypothetical protein GQ55_5G411800 [Panicum hallii var. hallii]
MEDLAASLMPHSHSAPLYLLYDLSASFPSKHGLAPPVPLHDDDDGGGDGFEFAATARNAGGAAALRACASDVSAAAFADELLRAGALLPLSLPPRLQRPAYSAGASAATSPTSASSAAAHAGGRGGRKHRGFDPFAAALEKVRRDGAAAAAAPKRARSLSPLRAAADASSSAHKKSSNRSRAPRPAPAAAVAARRARRGVRHLLCRVVMAGAAVAPKALWPRRKDGVSYRPGLLVCLGYGV